MRHEYPDKNHLPQDERPQTRRGARADLYQNVTDTMIAQLEAGTVPWVQPWGRVDIAAPCALPQNAHTGHIYSGINILFPVIAYWTKLSF